MAFSVVLENLLNNISRMRSIAGNSGLMANRHCEEWIGQIFTSVTLGINVV